MFGLHVKQAAHRYLGGYQWDVLLCLVIHNHACIALCCAVAEFVYAGFASQHKLSIIHSNSESSERTDMRLHLALSQSELYQAACRFFRRFCLALHVAELHAVLHGLQA